MHISLTEHLEEIVKSKVESGLYNNASEVVREALRQMVQNDEAQKMKLERLRYELELAEKQFENGEYSSFNGMKEIIESAKKKYNAEN